LQQCVRDADGVERNIDAPRLIYDGLQMAVHGAFVESVYLSRFGPPSCIHDPLSNCVNLAEVTAGQEHSRTFPRECSGNGRANCSTASVDHGNLIL
jgi:hypothetical protein